MANIIKAELDLDYIVKSLNEKIDYANKSNNSALVLRMKDNLDGAKMEEEFASMQLSDAACIRNWLNTNLLLDMPYSIEMNENGEFYLEKE